MKQLFTGVNMSSNMLLVCWILLFIWICSAELPDCKSKNNHDLVISILNRRNDTGPSSTQVNLEDEKSSAKHYSIQVNLDRDLKSCSCDSANGTEKPEPPRPFYELIPGMGYYKLHTDFKNWHNAKVICEKEGTHLAIMNSLEEVAVLQEFWRRQPRQNNAFVDDIIYLGFDDIQTEGVWKTIFNKPLSGTGFTEWESGEPHSGPNENCGCIYAKTGHLHDCICSDVLPFFCEKEL